LDWGETAFREREGPEQAGLGLGLGFGLQGFGSGGFRRYCRRVDRYGKGGQRIGTVGTEAAAAVQALQVVEDTIIDGGTDTGTCQATGSAADQTTYQGTGKPADTPADGTGERPEGKADLGASNGTGSPTSCPADRPDERAGFLGQILGDDALGTTDWAIQTHGETPSKVETTTKIRQRCLTGGMAGGWVGVLLWTVLAN
jgi:hypothetical protein